jgi:hypothetical protein
MWPVVYGGFVFTAVPAWARVWFAGPAVYVLCRRELCGRVAMLHIGEAEDLAEDIGCGNPIWDRALALGMSEIHVHMRAGDLATRRGLLARLRRRYPTMLDPTMLDREHPRQGNIVRLADAMASPQRDTPTSLLDWLEMLVIAPPRSHAAAAGQPGTAMSNDRRPRTASGRA